MEKFFNVNPKVEKASEKALEKVKNKFAEIDRITEFNQQKMLNAFIKNKVSESAHFVASTGYGYNDIGRETLDKVMADALGAEDCIIRHTFTCGTHTLAVALFGLLRPGNTMLAVTGRPYDTIQPIIGISGEAGEGSLKEWGVNYREVLLDENGKPDLEKIKEALKDDVDMVYIQRSRGYSLRASLGIEEIEEIVNVVKANSKAIIMVDNCYGEFVQEKEPVQVGADIMAGSLIKNPGGAIAPCGGYIAGRKDLVEKCAYRMTTPGLGREVGATLGHNRELFMGIFNAPHITGEAVKSAVFTSALFEELGFGVTPSSDEKRCDIIQAVKLENQERLIAFCQGMQKGAPVDSFVTPEPWDMPGYDSKVIMSAGAFTLGSSIELSADAPLREPYAVWMQGGINFHTAKVGIMLAASEIADKGLI
ncbi:MAG: methionine gamma-lyase family protein [Clostridiales bacterium]|nr:methionine gamma-lyase family protein [Clostridiales bacterium]